MAWFLGFLIGLLVGLGAFAWWYLVRRRQHMAEVEALDRRASKAEHQVAATAEQLATTRGDLEASRRETETVRGELADTSDSLAARSDELSAARDELAASRAETDGVRGELEAARDGAERFAGEKAEEIAGLTAEMDALRTAGLQLRSELDVATARIGELEARLELLATPDDLKRIKGIGPAFEAALAGLGIHSYRSVAAITDEGSGWIEQALDTFSERMSREEWRQQAAALHAEKYGETP